MLSHTQYQQLLQILLKAYPTKARFVRLLKLWLDIDLDSIALGDDLTEIVFKVIQDAESRGWTAQLFLAARADNTNNAQLVALAQQLNLAPTGTPARNAVEKIIFDSHSFLDVNAWRLRLGLLEGQICRIETPVSYGTGFLIGPSTILTNHHVMRQAIEGVAKPEDVILRFDYKKIADGTTINSGTIYHLVKQEWLIDCSPNSPIDFELQPNNDLPKPDELDYALLQVDGTPGDDVIGKAERAVGDIPARGFIEIPSAMYAFEPDTAIFILQHPQAAPLKLAIETRSVVRVNANHTRVRYRTNTEPGSSGSPCFNSNWDLVALHHSGDPQEMPTYNEGIPISTIRSLILQRGYTIGRGES